MVGFIYASLMLACFLMLVRPNKTIIMLLIIMGIFYPPLIIATIIRIIVEYYNPTSRWKK